MANVPKPVDSVTSDLIDEIRHNYEYVIVFHNNIQLSWNGTGSSNIPYCSYNFLRDEFKRNVGKPTLACVTFY